jgi:hypothetical protein
MSALHVRKAIPGANNAPPTSVVERLALDQPGHLVQHKVNEMQGRNLATNARET